MENGIEDIAVIRGREMTCKKCDVALGFNVPWNFNGMCRRCREENDEAEKQK